MLIQSISNNLKGKKYMFHHLTYIHPYTQYNFMGWSSSKLNTYFKYTKSRRLNCLDLKNKLPCKMCRKKCLLLCMFCKVMHKGHRFMIPRPLDLDKISKLMKWWSKSDIKNYNDQHSLNLLAKILPSTQSIGYSNNLSSYSRKFGK